MIKKIVLLSISAVLFATTCMLGIRADDVSYGCGDGQDAEIRTCYDLAELLKSLRTTDLLFQPSASGDEISYTSYSMTEHGSNHIRSDRTTENDTSRTCEESVNERSHTMDAYYTESAVYYHPVGRMRNSTVREVFDLKGNGEKILKSRNVDSTVQEYDAEIYLIEGKVYAKYNRINMTVEKYTETRDEQGNLVRQAVDEESVRIATQTVDCIRDNCGKWIDFTTEEIVEPEDTELSDEKEKEFFIRVLVNQISETYCRTILGQNDQNIGYLNTLGQALAGLTDGDVVEEKGYFRLGDEVAKNYFLQFGYGNGEEYTPGSLAVSFADASKPIVYQEVSSSYGSDVYSKSVGVSAKTTFFNLNNTVVRFQNRNVISAYELFAPMLEELADEIRNEAKGDQ